MSLELLDDHEVETSDVLSEDNNKAFFSVASLTLTCARISIESVRLLGGYDTSLLS